MIIFNENRCCCVVFLLLFRVIFLIKIFLSKNLFNLQSVIYYDVIFALKLMRARCEGNIFTFYVIVLLKRNLCSKRPNHIYLPVFVLLCLQVLSEGFFWQWVVWLWLFENHLYLAFIRMKCIFWKWFADEVKCHYVTAFFARHFIMKFSGVSYERVVKVYQREWSNERSLCS